MRSGEIYKTNKNGYLKVVNYTNNKDVIVEFIDTGYQTKTQAVYIRDGVVKDPMRPSMYEVGYRGTGIYTSKSKSCKIWEGMLCRCYSKKSLKENPTYRDCSVSKDWHNFQVFAKWYEQNYVEGYHLDKDLLVVGNRVYSQDTCVFVPPKINSFLTNSAASRGEYLIGVCYDKRDKKYVAQCGNVGGIGRNIGYFTDPQLAHMAWRGYKLQLALGMKPEMDAIDERIYPNVVTIINNSK